MMLLPLLLAFATADLTPETVSRLRIAWTHHTTAHTSTRALGTKGSFPSDAGDRKGPAVPHHTVQPLGGHPKPAINDHLKTGH
jgi:hypothetical protein